MDTSANHLVGVAIPTLRQLRAAAMASGPSESSVELLRDAGYAGGEALLGAFERWLAESRNSPGDVRELDLHAFAGCAAEFFRGAGWGEMTFGGGEDEGIATVDISDCWEGGLSSDGPPPGCHLTTGLLAAFFGRIAGYPVAVLETECCGGDGGSRCRFLLGNAEMMNWKWDELNRTG